MLIVLGEESTRKTSINAQEIEASLEAARLFGCRVYMMPSDFSECETADNALAYLSEFDPPILGMWVGYIPTIEHYTAIYDTAFRKGVRLVNSPEQHQLAMEFDHFYPLLNDITPKSAIVESVTELATVLDEYNFPLFVKGAVKSHKEQGLKAVIAENVDELTNLTERILSNSYRSRGKAIIREFVRLRQVDETPKGFPISREYRVFVHKNEIVAYSFYWDEFEDEPLTGQDTHSMLSLALEAATRLKVPYIAVDIGQREDGEWIVIEVGDAQFCGLSQVPILEVWSKLKDFS